MLVDKAVDKEMRGAVGTAIGMITDHNITGTPIRDHVGTAGDELTGAVVYAAGNCLLLCCKLVEEAGKVLIIGVSEIGNALQLRFGEGNHIGDGNTGLIAKMELQRLFDISFDIIAVQAGNGFIWRAEVQNVIIAEGKPGYDGICIGTRGCASGQAGVGMVQLNFDKAELLGNGGDEGLYGLRGDLTAEYTELGRKGRLIEVGNAILFVPGERHYGLIIVEHKRAPVPAHMIEVSTVRIRKAVRGSGNGIVP